MNFDIEKQLLLRDRAKRQELFSATLKAEIAMTSFDLPGGCSLSILSPAYSPKARYFSPVIRVPPRTSLELDGTFEVMTVDAFISLEIKAVESGRAGAGHSEQELQPFRSVFDNQSKKPSRFGLRLCPVDELPEHFLLFSPRLGWGGHWEEISPVMFGFVPERGPCIFD
ncbi:hypothetical protein [Solimonas sp. K1W22B-7]|uniref:hypothetical protein n=1 Tax=Solimonas sp. K1W22B-7 TaxID=2303331 RepID=UPI0013C4D162|nr:hypothetical protein [Solimonas sp. K1W22B-7]